MTGARTTPQNEMTANIMINKIDTNLDNLFRIYEGVPEDMRAPLVSRIEGIKEKTSTFITGAKQRLKK